MHDLANVAIKITSVIDKAPQVSSSMIIYGREEQPVKKPSYAKPLLLGALGITAITAFIYLIRHMQQGQMVMANSLFYIFSQRPVM